MPDDSVVIYYHDTSFVYTGKENLPPGLDTTGMLQRMIDTRARALERETNQPEWLVPSALFILFLIVLSIVKIYSVYNRKSSYVEPPAEGTEPAYRAFRGDDLDFDPQLLHYTLQRFFNYYQRLEVVEKQRFIKRLDNFIRSKTYIIPASEGYREMPILISAAAIQLTFGLKDYMLPWYEYITVHIREYIMLNPLRAIAGNVLGKNISLSWKHFLEDYQKNEGVNVGLHEMAHALQMQHEYFYGRRGEAFRMLYKPLATLEEAIKEKEQFSRRRLYTDYALTSTDEFWASTVEIFFEQPERLLQQYPAVYDAIKNILNQDLVISTSDPCQLYIAKKA